LGKKPEIERLRGTKGKDRGMFLENFKMGKGDYSGIAGWKNDGSAQTSDVRQYPSNDLGSMVCMVTLQNGLLMFTDLSLMKITVISTTIEEICLRLS
jgi:hypothetical protein